MEFRPCIDIHNGKVKQIVGGSLQDQGDQAKENFVSEQDAPYYAQFYKKDGIRGGHIILLNASDSEYYEATKTQALAALRAYPGGLQVGGGIRPENAREFLDAGASHVIVTSYVFKDGKINYDNLEKLFKGQDILCLSAQGELEKIQNILREFPALSIADMKEAEEAETYRFQLKVQDQADYRKQLFFRFAEAGIPLLEISRAGMSLEDIFLEITEEGRA